MLNIVDAVSFDFFLSINGSQCILTKEYNVTIKYKGKATDLNHLKLKIESNCVAKFILT